MARLERGDLTYIINDHLGTPKEVVGWEGGLRWSADHDTWGTLRTRAGKASTQIETGDYWVEPTSNAGNTERAYAPEPDHVYCPIRFQGQWEDAETGLYYNRFRFYEPLVTKYINPDPIGIFGGVRPHSYVWQPNLFLDPFGLASRRCCRAACRARDRAREGKVRYLPDDVYHGRLDNALEGSILSNPDGVYLAGNGNLIFHQGENVVITHGPGSTAGQVLTSYGSGGPRGPSGASIFGGTPDMPGMPVTADMVANGRIPDTNGGFQPAAEHLDLDNC